MLDRPPSKSTDAVRAANRARQKSFYRRQCVGGGCYEGKYTRETLDGLARLYWPHADYVTRAEVCEAIQRLLAAVTRREAYEVIHALLIEMEDLTR